MELTLRVADAVVVAHAPGPPAGPVTSVDWSDADVLSFSP
jgi:hypothetical protein